jgi:hypothetical protein
MIYYIPVLLALAGLPVGIVAGYLINRVMRR